MKSMVVLFALAAVACGSLVPVAQPPHHPAIVLDPHGRPLDTAEVINARAVHLQAKALEGHYAHLEHAAVVAPVTHSVVAPVAIAAPAAVSHQSRVDVISSPAVVSHAVAAPALAYSAYGLAGHGLAGHGLAAHGLAAHGLAAHGLAAHGHYLKKRSLGHLAYAAPIVSHAVVAAPSAVSHQSRVDVISSPAVVSHAVAAPIVSHAVAAPVLALAPAAVSHQSRVDVHTSPAVVATTAYGYGAHGYAAHGYAAPYSHGVVAGPLAHAGLLHSTHAGLALSHSHLLKKRSLATILTPVVHAYPAAVSHQSRVDVISKPAVTEVVAAPVFAHSAHGLYAAPIAHSAIWSAPLALRAAHW